MDTQCQLNVDVGKDIFSVYYEKRYTTCRYENGEYVWDFEIDILEIIDAHGQFPVTSTPSLEKRLKREIVEWEKIDFSKDYWFE